MNKLHRVADGQAIQFVTLPRIFTKLASDLPSGFVSLPNGERAYYRITRNMAELNKRRRDMGAVVQNLADALKAMVNSQAFLNQYGLSEVPEVDYGRTLQQNLRNLLLANVSVVEYRTTMRGQGKGLLEQINVNLGNLVTFHAVRGDSVKVPDDAKFKGKFHLSISADVADPFLFWIHSPFVDLSTVISADRLAEEVLAKLRVHLIKMGGAKALEFDAGQFQGYRQNALETLDTKKRNKPINVKQPAGLTDNIPGVAGTDFVLDEARFRKLLIPARAEYLSNLRTATADMQRAFLMSDVLQLEYNQHVTSPGQKRQKLTRPYFLARKIGMKDNVVEELLGTEGAKYLAPADEIGEADAGLNVVAQAAALMGDAPVCEGDACSLTPAEPAPIEPLESQKLIHHHGNFATTEELRNAVFTNPIEVGDTMILVGREYAAEMGEDGIEWRKQPMFHGVFSSFDEVFSKDVNEKAEVGDTLSIEGEVYVAILIEPDNKLGWVSNKDIEAGVETVEAEADPAQAEEPSGERRVSFNGIDDEQRQQDQQ